MELLCCMATNPYPLRLSPCFVTLADTQVGVFVTNRLGGAHRMAEPCAW
jgi:hypothetical protein